MIEIRNIYKYFNGNCVLDDVTTTFERGKCNVIIGSSGSGKTVLMKSIVGLTEIDSGEIFYDQVDFVSLSRKERQALRIKMGMMFQGGALFDSLNIEENVMFPLNMFTDNTYAEKKKRVDFCLERVGLFNVQKQIPAELSGGMKKRAAIARAIAHSPEYLFCDEPNSGLDPKTAIKIDTLIREITAEYQITTLVNTHDMNSVLEIGDSVVFIHEGKVSWTGTKEDVLHTNNQSLNSFVFATRMAQQIKEK